MNSSCFKRLLPILVVGLAAAATPSLAAVNLELRPPSQTVVNGTTFSVEIWAVSDSGVNEDVGVVQMVFTWNPQILKLQGRLNNSPYVWDYFNFPTTEPLNMPLTGGVPANDGDAVILAAAPIQGAPAQAPPPPGLLVGTLRFRALTTGTNTIIAIADQIGGTTTFVLDARVNGVDVTGTLGPPVTVTVICNGDPDCNDGNECTTDTCTPQQTCQHVLATPGTPCGSSGSSECDNPDTCDSSGTCVPNYVPPGTSCGSPTNNECTNPDTCNGAGVCQPNHEPAGTACGDPSDTTCTNPDTCNSSGVCQANHEPTTTMCRPSAGDCDVAELCDGAGNCPSDGFASPGTPCGDPTDNACTDPDTCNANGVCLPNNFSCPPTTPYCKVVDNQPVCVECLLPEHCSDGNPCTTDFCDFVNVCHNSPDPMNGQPCPDEVFCDGVEVCQGGNCIPGPEACDDGNVCTDDFCDEDNDTCESFPNDDNDCDDGLWCNGINDCVNGNCIPVTPPNCDDGNVCTDDFCDEDVDDCAHPPNIEPCEDGNACTLDDQCGGGTCQPGPPPTGSGLVNLVWVPSTTTVRIDNPVTLALYAVSADATPDEAFTFSVILSWNSAKLQLVGQNDSNSPVDWLVSTFPDDSQQDGLNFPFSGVPGNDGDAYYEAWAPLGAPAPVPPSGLLITEFTFNAIGLGNSPLQIPNCVGDWPTVTRIDGGAAGLIHGTLGSANINVVQCITSAHCNDGQFCNGVETCVANNCVAGTPPCNDSNPCTDDSCNEGNDTCNNVPDNSNDPDDGLFCNGVNTCQGGVIIIGQPPDCDDGNECTDDSCSEPVRDCVHANNTAPCNDGDPCTFADACSGGACSGIFDPSCVPCASDIECDDGFECTVDACDLSLGFCTIDLYDHEFCRDTVFCNGFELCDPATGDPVTGCAPGVPPCDPCDEQTGCDCDVPVASAAGGRYLRIEPQLPATSTPMALRISYCTGIFKYVGAPEPWDVNPVPGPPTPDGSFAVLVDNPAQAVYLTPNDWGSIVWVTGLDIVPDTAYEVQADCGVPGSPALSAPIEVRTWRFGDVDNNGDANFIDISTVVRGFQGNWTTPSGAPTIKPNVDLHGCMPNRDINFQDISWAVRGFQNVSYSTFCSTPCGP